MAEIERNPFANPELDEGLEGEDPGNPQAQEQYLEVYDDKGNPRKLRVIFSVRDTANNAAYIFVEQGEDEVLGLATKIDADGNPLQDELEVIGEGSPYLAPALEFLKAYNEGNLSHETDAEDAAKIIASRESHKE